MDTPQEVEVWFILPALRKLFVSSFKKQGLKQKEIAKLMKITEPAVSQYLKNKRGNKIDFSTKIQKKVEIACKNIDNSVSYRFVFQKTLKMLKKSKFVCDVCKDHINTDDACEICYGD